MEYLTYLSLRSGSTRFQGSAVCCSKDGTQQKLVAKRLPGRGPHAGGPICNILSAARQGLNKAVSAINLQMPDANGQRKTLCGSSYIGSGSA